MEGGGAGRPVARALLTVDRPPGEGRTREAELGRPVQGRGQRVPAPPQGAGHRVGRGEREHRQDEGLGIPERVPVVPGPGQTLRGNRAALPAGSGLQHVEQREPHRLLHLGIPVDLHVRAVPEVVEVRALIGEQAVPAGLPRRGQGRPHLVTHGRQRSGA